MVEDKVPGTDLLKQRFITYNMMGGEKYSAQDIEQLLGG